MFTGSSAARQLCSSLIVTFDVQICTVTIKQPLENENENYQLLALTFSIFFSTKTFNTKIKKKFLQSQKVQMNNNNVEHIIGRHISCITDTSTFSIEFFA